jgi:hypothetical protein
LNIDGKDKKFNPPSRLDSKFNVIMDEVAKNAMNDP